MWTAENDALEELEDRALEHTEATDSWAHALELIAKEQSQMKATERTGRGVRRKAAIAAENQVQSVVFLAPISAQFVQQKFDFIDSPIKDKPRGRQRKKSGSTESEAEESKAEKSEESDVYVSANPSQSENSSDEALGDEVRQDIAELGVTVVEGSKAPTRLPPSTADPVSQSNPTYTYQNRPAVCAMCGDLHHGTCGMAERSENLVHYRQILFTEQTGESFEERVCSLSTLWWCSL